MIFEAFVSILVGIVEFIAGLFGDLQAPAWLADVQASWAGVMGQLAGLGAWVPWSFVRGAMLAVLACVAIGFTIKVVRSILSLFTGGGGSSA